MEEQEVEHIGPEKKKSKTFAVQSFDGEINIVEADEFRICVPTKECIKFWVMIGACFVCIAIGLFLMLYEGPTSVYFFIGEGLLVMAVGVLIPGPQYETVAPRRVAASSAPAPTDQHDDSPPRLSLDEIV